MEQCLSLSQCRLRISSLTWSHLLGTKETGPARLVGMSVVRVGMPCSGAVGCCWWVSQGPGKPCQTLPPTGSCPRPALLLSMPGTLQETWQAHPRSAHPFFLFSSQLKPLSLLVSLFACRVTVTVLGALNSSC